MKKFVTFAGLLMTAVLGACSDINAPAPMTLEPQAGVTAALPPDPCPTCNGHWIGFSDAECVTTLTDDQDQDGFRDTCEQRLAEFFRPYLVMSQSDDTRGHEPYWAANSAEPGFASLFWAFAYYEDAGAFDKTGLWCGTTLDNLYERWSCDAHPGDSESLVMNLAYNEVTRHWEISNVLMSRHGQYSQVLKGNVQYSGPQYGYPTVYVAWGKHANYQSDSACDGGGYSGSDECVSDYVERDFFSAYRNLGSSTHQLLNCVQSQGLYAGTGRQECFWTTTGDFRGWTGLWDQQPVAQYGVMLRDRGF